MILVTFNEYPFLKYWFESEEELQKYLIENKYTLRTRKIG